MASGDNRDSVVASPRHEETKRLDLAVQNELSKENDGVNEESTCPQAADDEAKLKQRIANCKQIVDALKLQMSEQKETMYTEENGQPSVTDNCLSEYHEDYCNPDSYGNSSIYSASVDSKLNYDETLIEYEMQLQKYQDTLHLAETAKKNAIRKKMLAKAFKLKLMEIENQCNIELLRVKQCQHCLEPLEMMMNKWKMESDNNAFDADNYELPSLLEFKPQSGSDVRYWTDDNDIGELKLDEPVNPMKDE